MIRRMKKSRIMLISILLVFTIIAGASLGACSNKIQIAAQPTLITPPTNKPNSLDALAVDPDNFISLPEENKIDFEKDNPKKIIEKAWLNTRYAPVTMIRQTGDVSTVTLGLTVVQSVSTYRYSERNLKDIGTFSGSDSGRPGLKQSINYMQSYSVTSQGISGVDIRLMVESLRLPSGKYIHRQATDAKNIKLDPNTADFYNLSGKWDVKKANDIESFHNYNKDDPNDILAYDVREETISVATKKDNDFTSGVYAADDNPRKGEYAQLASEIVAKTVPNVYVYEVRFNPLAWEGNYLKIMYDMLALGGQSGNIDYKGLKMNIEIWETGFIRQISFEESYQLALGPINAKASLISNLQISYQAKQMLNDKMVNWRRKFLKKTGKNFSNRRKPGAEVDVAQLK